MYSDYYPYGLVINEGANNYRYGYQGQYAEKDPETDWNAFELRMYDSKIGRWLTTDPEAEFWSPYVAMGNDPTNTLDPTGGETGDDICPGPGCLPEIIIKSSPMNNYGYRQWASTIDALYKKFDYDKVYNALLEGGVGARALNIFSIAWSTTEYRERYDALTDASREAQILLLKEGATFVVGRVAGKILIKGAIWGYRAYSVHRYGSILASSSEIATVTVQSPEAVAVAAKGVTSLEKASGSYLLEFQSGKFYAGKGLESRMMQSVNRIETKFGDKLLNKTFYPAANSKAAFINEHKLMMQFGGPKSFDKFSPTYNLIFSPGKKLGGF